MQIQLLVKVWSALCYAEEAMSRNMQASNAFVCVSNSIKYHQSDHAKR